MLGNSLYCASILDSRRFRKITYTDSISVNRAANSNRFVYLNEICDDLYEIKSLKKNIIHDKPLQVGVFVCQYSKLHMPKFFCCFLSKYLLKRHWEFVYSDTNAFFVSISKDNLDDCVPQHLTAQCCREKRVWLPAECCNDCLN